VLARKGETQARIAADSASLGPNRAQVMPTAPSRMRGPTRVMGKPHGKAAEVGIAAKDLGSAVVGVDAQYGSEEDWHDASLEEGSAEVTCPSLRGLASAPAFAVPSARFCPSQSRLVANYFSKLPHLIRDRLRWQGPHAGSPGRRCSLRGAPR
jgi:hypothetical protein